MVITQSAAVRQAIEGLYDATMTVSTQQKKTDPKTNLTTTGWAPVPELTDIACRLSYKTVTTTSPSNGGAAVAQTVQVFTAPEHNIPAGSRISITAKGVTVDYKQSGPPERHANHQQIPLELTKEWA